MKKLLILLLAICLIFVGVAGCAQKDAPAPSPAPVATSAEPTPEPAFATEAPAPYTASPEAGEEAAAPRQHVDLEALHDLYPEDMLYATVGEREITWGEY